LSSGERATLTWPSDLAERVIVDAGLEGAGWDAVLSYEPRQRLTRRDFAIGFA